MFTAPGELRKAAEQMAGDCVRQILRGASDPMTIAGDGCLARSAPA